MALGCRLSPWFFAGFYSYAMDAGFAHFMDRLDALDLDSDWLEFASQRYTALGRANPEPMSDRHAMLANWLIARERTEPSPTYGEVSAEISAFIEENTSDVPREKQGSVYLWTVVEPISHSTWGHLPAIPAVFPEDGDLASAFEGLLEHARLAEADASHGEITVTSLTWRAAALVDGLLPKRSDGDHPEGRLRDLIGGLPRTVSVADLAAFDLALVNFNHDRNALTHLRPDGGGVDAIDGGASKGFAEVRDRFVEITAARNRVWAITAATLHQIAEEQAEHEPPRGVATAVGSELREAEWAESF